MLLTKDTVFVLGKILARLYFTRQRNILPKEKQTNKQNASNKFLFYILLISTLVANNQLLVNITYLRIFFFRYLKQNY